MKCVYVVQLNIDKSNDTLYVLEVLSHHEFHFYFDIEEIEFFIFFYFICLWAMLNCAYDRINIVIHYISFFFNYAATDPMNNHDNEFRKSLSCKYHLGTYSYMDM